MLAQPLMFVGLVLMVLLAVVPAIMVGMSRHKKSAGGKLNLMGAVAFVETTLNPEGAVLVDGELWLARLRTPATLERGRSVRVVGASGHLLEVEPTE